MENSGLLPQTQSGPLQRKNSWATDRLEAKGGVIFGLRKRQETEGTREGRRERQKVWMRVRIIEDCSLLLFKGPAWMSGSWASSIGSNPSPLLREGWAGQGSEAPLQCHSLPGSGPEVSFLSWKFEMKEMCYISDKTHSLLLRLPWAKSDFLGFSS